MNSHGARGVVIAGLTMGILGSALSASPARAEAVEHVAEAIEHANEAIKHGKQGHTDLLGEHADGALRYAKEAHKLIQDEHLDEAMDELEAAFSEVRPGTLTRGCSMRRRPWSNSPR